MASERISRFFGEGFEAQDDVPKQTRMPGPPLLLVDRITGIDAPQGEIGAGSIWSETKVSGDRWYMHQGRMASGVLVETGQADLLLISWMGVDKFNEGRRVYRLLGCEITFHDALPKAGEILSHDIHIDRHVSAGATRLFFFHSTCRVNGDKRLSIINGQAGFFTEEELNGSRGLFLPPTPPAPPNVRHVLPGGHQRSDELLKRADRGFCGRACQSLFRPGIRDGGSPRQHAAPAVKHVATYASCVGFRQRRRFLETRLSARLHGRDAR
ncbi:MAG: hypothetical protein AAYR33_05960 [Acetobacteraceae bacterium]